MNSWTSLQLTGDQHVWKILTLLPLQIMLFGNFNDRIFFLSWEIQDSKKHSPPPSFFRETVFAIIIAKGGKGYFSVVSWLLPQKEPVTIRSAELDKRAFIRAVDRATKSPVWGSRIRGRQIAVFYPETRLFSRRDPGIGAVCCLRLRAGSSSGTSYAKATPLFLFFFSSSSSVCRI